MKLMKTKAIKPGLPEAVSAAALSMCINGIFSMDPGYEYAGGNSSYIAAPLSVMGSLLLLLAVTRALRVSKSEDLAGYLCERFGSFGAVLIAIPIFAALFICASRPLFVFVQVLHRLIYDGVKLYSLCIFIIPVILFTALKSADVIGRLGRCIEGILILSLIVLIATSLRGFESYRFYPLIGDGLPHMIGLCASESLYFAAPLSSLLIFGIKSNDEDALRRSVIRSSLAALIIVTAAKVAVSFAFSPSSLDSILMPLYRIGFIDPRPTLMYRYDKLFVMVWLAGAMVSSAYCVSSASHLASRVVDRNLSSGLVLLIMALITGLLLAIPMISESTLDKIFGITDRFGAALIVLPLALITVPRKKKPGIIKKRKRIFIRSASLLLTVLTAAMSFTACLGPVSLDAYGYVISIGIDKGKEKQYAFTLMLQRDLAEPETENEGGASILFCEADSLDEAVIELESGVPFTLSFSRTNFFIFGQEIAQSGRMRELLSISFDSMKIRPSAAVVIANGRAFDYIGGLAANNDSSIKKLQSALMLEAEKTGMITIMSAELLLEAANDGRFDFCTAIGEYDEDVVTDMEEKKNESEGKDPVDEQKTEKRMGGLKSSITGAALFSGWQMTGALDLNETMFLNMACGDFKNGTLTLPYEEDGEEKDEITLILSAKKLSRRIDLSGNVPIAYVDIDLLAGTHKTIPGLDSQKLNEWISTFAADHVKASLIGVFYKCREAGSDAMRFGAEAIRQFRTEDQWREYDWKQAYKSMEAVFSVSIKSSDKLTLGDLS